MNRDQNPHELAQKLLDGELDEQQFLRRIAKLTMASTHDANLDLDRMRRVGYPEVVFAEGKTNQSLVEIVTRLQQAGQPVLVTRVNEMQAEAVLAECGGLVHRPAARTIRSTIQPEQETVGCVAVITAGTSDLPVAEEVAETLRWMNCTVERIQDVGVAGPQRLPAHLDQLENADCVVVVAGMEGALPSVVAGYLAVPIIGVPTSVGYGASFNGVAALLSMLNSCAANVAVVNIDAGFKAGYLAGMIASATHGRQR